MTSTPSSTATHSTAATAPTEMDHMPVNPIDPIGPPVLQTQASSTSSVALPVSAQHTHRRPRTTDLMSPSGSTTDAPEYTTRYTILIHLPHSHAK